MKTNLHLQESFKNGTTYSHIPLTQKQLFKLCFILNRIFVCILGPITPQKKNYITKTCLNVFDMQNQFCDEVFNVEK